MNEIIPLPPHLKRGYAPGHQVTRNYSDGMDAIEANRIEEAIAILALEASDSPCRGLALGNAGLALLRLEKFEQAIEKLHEADKHFNEYGCPHPPSWIQFSRNHAEAIAFGRPFEALDCFNKAVLDAKDLVGDFEDCRRDVELEIAHVFNSWGATLLRLGKKRDAINRFKDGRDIYRKYEAENKIGLAETLTNLSFALRADEKKNEASLALQEALDVARSGGDKDQIRRIEIATVQLDPAFFDGDPLKMLDEAVEEAIGDGRYSTGYVRLCIKAVIAENVGDFSTGLMACNRALKIEHRLDSSDYTPAQMRINFARLLVSNGSPLVDVLNVLLEGADLWWSQLGKEQVSADVLGKVNEMHDHFRFLARMLLEAGRVEEACMAFESGRALGFALEVDQAVLPKILSLAPFGGSKASVNCKGLQIVQSSLLNNEVIVSLAILPPDIVAFVIRRDCIEVVGSSLPSEVDCDLLFQSIRNIPRLLHKKEGIDAIPTVVKDFAGRIVERVGLGSIISVIPNSILHSVPWRALLRSMGANWSELSMVTRFGLFVPSREKSVMLNNAIALGHGMAGSIDLIQEARDFAFAFGKRGAVIENSTSSDLRRSVLKPGVVLVSCHGILKEDLIRGNYRLYLSLQDGDKLVDEIFPDRIAADCIVLSACDSGVYEVARGDYPVGAAPDLLRKGVKCCLATRFPVNAAFAADFIRIFAEYLASGEPVQVAVGKTLNMVESNGADFWNEIACFELLG